MEKHAGDLIVESALDAASNVCVGFDPRLPLWFLAISTMSQVSGLPAAFIRKEAKSHGTAKLAEGASVQGKNILLVEDVVSSGGQIVLSTKDLRGIGADVTNAICVLDRSEGKAKENLEEINVKLSSLFTRDELVGGFNE